MNSKRQNAKLKTKKIALSAILIALSVIILYIGSLTQILDLTMIAVASLIICFTVIEMQGWYPYLVYAGTAILSLVLLPDKFSAIIYTIFGGIYPIFKEMFERRHRIVSWLLKFSFFNIAVFLAWVITVKLLALIVDESGLTILVFLVCNVTFLVYDIALTKLITLYLLKFRKLLGLKNYFKV